MSELLNQPVAPEQMRVFVEIGQGYVPDEKVAAALAALAEALQSDDDVQGFKRGEIASFIYDSGGPGDPSIFRSIPEGIYRSIPEGIFRSIPEG